MQQTNFKLCLISFTHTHTQNLNMINLKWKLENQFSLLTEILTISICITITIRWFKHETMKSRAPHLDSFWNMEPLNCYIKKSRQCQDLIPTGLLVHYGSKVFELKVDALSLVHGALGHFFPCSCLSSLSHDDI